MPATRRAATAEASLIANTLDYLLEAADHAKKAELRNWKYAVLHTVAAIELLIKARLQKEHWSLIFADADNASEGALSTGDFVSVDFKSALKRLQNITGVSLDDQTRQRLDDLRKFRNQIQHYAFTLDKAAILPLVAYGLNFCLDFIRDELNDRITSETQRLVGSVAKRLRGFRNFIKKRLKLITPRLRAAEGVVRCPRCWQQSMAIQDEQRTCHFCGFRPTADQLASEISPEDEYGYYVKECPECENPCVRTQTGLKGQGPEWICLVCAEHGDYSICEMCGRLQQGDLNPGERCDNCWNYILGKDD